VVELSLMESQANLNWMFSEIRDISSLARSLE
jgi:hypothetical protein